jgi:hypothetical protein
MPTGIPSYNGDMTYTVTLRDRTLELVDGADAFSHERLMTTFFRTNNDRGAVDCWSVPLASFRTDEILMIRRDEPQVPESIEVSAFAHNLQP